MDDERALLIDSGLFQSAETFPESRTGVGNVIIDFSLGVYPGAVATLVHIYYVGRIPYLLLGGFGMSVGQMKFVWCTATSQLDMLADALRERKC